MDLWKRVDITKLGHNPDCSPSFNEIEAYFPYTATIKEPKIIMVSNPTMNE